MMRSRVRSTCQRGQSSGEGCGGGSSPRLQLSRPHYCSILDSGECQLLPASVVGASPADGHGSRGGRAIRGRQGPFGVR